LIISHNASPDSPKGKALIFFKNRVEELTENKIQVLLYSKSTYFKDSEVLKALKLDKVQIACPSFSKFLTDIPQLNIFELPFLFDNYTHIYKTFDSIVGETIREKASENGYIVLNFWDKGFKQLTTSRKKPIIYPSDIRGQSIRIRALKVLEDTFNILRAKPKILPFNTVNKLLKKAMENRKKNNIIDGQENTISEIYKNEFYKNQSYLTISNHGYLGYLVVINKKYWTFLPQNIKNAIIRAMNEATIQERFETKKLEDFHLKKIKLYAKKNGKFSIINSLSDEQKLQWYSIVKEIYPKYYNKDKIGYKLITKAQTLK